MPLFSVIIPAFNRADLIGQTLASVVNQPDVEVIIVDDGSTDATREIVAESFPTVKLLRQNNRGPGAARNTALAVATGDYVAFLDSDDVWFPHSAATYAGLIAAHDQPAFIAGKPLIFSSPTCIGPAETSPVTVNVFGDYYASGDQWRWFSASSLVMRRDLFTAAGGYTNDWVNAEDADAAMRMGVEKTFVQITHPPTFGYRQHAGSAMSNLERTRAGIQRLITEEKAARFPGGPDRAYERRRIIATYVRPHVLELASRGHTATAFRMFRETASWQLAQRRWKFLAAFPIVLAKGAIKPS